MQRADVCKEPAVTMDGERVTLQANVELERTLPVHAHLMLMVSGFIELR